MNAVLHEFQEFAIRPKKLLDEFKITNGSESFAETHSHFARQQPLAIRHTYFRCVSPALGYFCASGAPAKQFERNRTADTEAVVVAADLFEAAET
jgi:hypothetical protein